MNLVKGTRSLVLVAGCLLLLLVAIAAAAGSPGGAVQQQNILVSTGGDSFGALLDPSPPAGSGANNEPPPWTGLFILVAGSLLGALWLGVVVLAVLNPVGMDTDSGDREQRRPSPERGGEKRDGGERRRRPSPHPSEWL